MAVLVLLPSSRMQIPPATSTVQIFPRRN